MKFRLMRHATFQIELGNQCLLIDPMLAEPYAYPSMTVGATASRNPLVPLPYALERLLHSDAIVVTHSHFDHFDRAAAKRLPKELPIFCQPSDRKRFCKHGFTDIHPVDRTGTTWNGLRIIRTGGKHGRGLIGKAIGPTSGFIIEASNEPRLYIAGDTIWCSAVRDAISDYQPDVIIVNAGAARFNIGAPITMATQDIVQVCQAVPSAKVVAVHMGAVNHCRLTRNVLAAELKAASAVQQVCIPQDGEELLF